MTRTQLQALLVTGVALLTLLGSGCSGGRPDSGQTVPPSPKIPATVAPQSPAPASASREPTSREPISPESDRPESASRDASDGSPKATVDRAIEAVSKQDCRAMKGEIVPKLAGRLGDCSAVFAQFGTHIKESAVSVGAPTVTGQTARVPVTIKGQRLNLTMMKISERWYISNATL